MTRSIPALALVVGGLLFGCGGMPEEGDSQVPSEGNVSQSAVTYIYGNGVTVVYNSASDSFTVHDTLADGHSAVARIYNSNTGSTTYCWNSNGAGTSAVCNRNYPNNPLLRISACTGEAGPGTIVACSSAVPVDAFAPTK
ncbi:hypothetical protein COCOR_02087 [Corallococcus coralloides DSM 2259]|uniref:Lipoprotein n=1 Tax=Corallococcus coralloides (strain ATCC 25202 / DSM 2259 / NBRC 100086 / M2) TaxID=1144275 RepID=H8MIY7_CORCM|nr:hypothetical protein [Corallococcus coralloides]AFE04466.1 hypothetical protein COCOR_02087 [Corallococcus coralloides DSM 2259]